MGLGASASGAPETRHEEAAWAGNARFRHVRRIGVGGMGVVYEAVDTQNDQHVALKTIARFDPGALYRFKQEFRALADVRHRNLVQLHELVVSDEDSVFFTMELVPGVDFVEFVRGAPRGEDGLSLGLSHTHAPTVADSRLLASVPTAAELIEGAQGPLPWSLANFERLRPALRQLVEGLDALHGAGKLHRDIKPSNVLVTPEGRVVLLDFGVAADLHPVGQGTGEDELVGTPLYMAPEQALGEALTPASDWYSVGVILFQSLVGYRPFEGKATDVLARKNTAEARAPSECVQGVPPDLDDLCRRLLRIDVAQRPGARDILRSLGAVRGAASLPPPSSGAPRTSDAPAAGLIGRDRPLQALRDAFEVTRAGRALTVRVSGRGGMGKSALVQQFIEELAASGEVNVLHGRAYERESVPYKAVDGVVDALSHLLVRQQDEESELALPRHTWALAHLFPVLRRVPGIEALPDREMRDVQRVRRRAFGAFRTLLASLARRRPLVVYIDDVQWGDVDSVVLLQEVMREPDAPALLLLMTHREEDATASPFLAEMEARWLESAESGEVRDVNVGPLDPEDTEALALSLIGRSDASARNVARNVTRESGGSPLLVEELVRSHAASRARDGDTLMSLTLDQMMSERLAALPDDMRRLVETVAVAGRPLRVAAASEAAGVSPESVVGHIVQLETQRLLRTGFRDGSNVVEPSHDRIRETLVAQIPEQALRDHHGRLAVAFESMATPDFEAAAVHRSGAGDLRAAAHHAERAAGDAEQKLAFDHAARLYRLALDALNGLGRDADAQRMRLRLAAALEQAGRAADAGEAFLEAATKASGIERIELERTGGEQLIVSGRLDRGEAALRRVMSTLSVPAPRSALGAVFLLVVYKIWLRLIGLGFRERETAEVSREDRVRVEALRAVASALSPVHIILSSCVSARQLILALAVGDRGQVAAALGMHAVQLAVEGVPEGGERERAVVKVVEDLSEKLGPEFRPRLWQMRAFLEYLHGHYAEAVVAFDKSRKLRTRREPGDVNADIFACYSLFYLGRYHEQHRRVARIMREVEDRGDRYAVVTMRSTVLVTQSLVHDDPDGARRHLRQASEQWPQEGFHLQHWYATFWGALVDLYGGDPEAARQRIERSTPALARSFLLHSHNVQMHSAYLGGGCALAAAAAGDPGKRGARIVEARRCLRVLEKQAFVPAQVFTSILRASLANVTGDRASAAAHLRQALERAEKDGLSQYAAAVHYRLGELAGGDEGDGLIARAEKAMRGEGVRVPERWVGVLVPGRWSNATKPRPSTDSRFAAINYG